MNNITIPLWFGALMVAFLGALVSLFLSLLIRGRSRLLLKDIFYGAVSPAIGVFVLPFLDILINHTISNTIRDNPFLLLLVCALIGYPILLLFLYMLKHPH
jgi:integral membrane sensor domain MASE1